MLDDNIFADFIVYLNLAIFVVYQVLSIIVLAKNRCRLDNSAIVSILSYLLCTVSIEATFIVAFLENNK